MPANNPLRTSNSVMAQRGANEVVLLDNGSYPGFSEYLNTTFEWNGTDWSIGTGTIALGPKPTRTDFALCYDGYNILMFGGRSEAETLSGSYTYNGTAWTTEAPVTVPYARFKSKLALLNTATPTAVMFGGENMNGCIDQTWVWDGNLKTWTLAAPTNKPAPRVDFMFADGPTVCVLFGGQNGQRLFGDCWSFNGSDWALNTPTTPPSYRYGACMAYDTANSEWVMFGGTNGYDTYQETWTLNAGRTAFTKEAPATSPAARVGATMCYDAQLGAVIMTGGHTPGNDYSYNDTWSWNGTTWLQL